jgi:predicted nucleic acid-binding protein
VIVLDTNVLSELARTRPDERVVAWLDSLAEAEVATTAITAAELRYGVARLPTGHRKDELAEAVRVTLDEDFADRALSFDAAAAEEYASVVAARERIGRPVSVQDAQIAAICRVLSATLATRNTSDFEDTGIGLLDPWHG